MLMGRKPQQKQKQKIKKLHFTAVNYGEIKLIKILPSDIYELR